MKFIADFGFGALFFGSILAVTATTQLFFSEIENRTALTLLAKPVHKLEFLAGKFLGAQMLMLAFVLVFSLVLWRVLYWREAALPQRLDVEAFDGGIIRYSDVFLFGFLQWLKFGVLAATITLFVASFSNTNLYTIVVSFFLLVICQLQYIARDAYADLEQGFGRFAGAGADFFKTFQLFNVGDQLGFLSRDALPLATVLQIALYAVVHITVFVVPSPRIFGDVKFDHPLVVRARVIALTLGVLVGLGH